MVDNNVTYITSGTEDRPAVTMTSGCIGLDLADWLLVGGSVGCWLVDRLTGWLIGWLVGWVLVMLLVERLAVWLTGRLVHKYTVTTYLTSPTLDLVG